MARKVTKKTKKNILKILKVLKKARKQGDIMTVSRIAKRAGIHKWSVSRILDLYMSPYVDIKVIEELDALGMKAKIISLAKPDITPEQAMRVLSVKLSR